MRATPPPSKSFGQRARECRACHFSIVNFVGVIRRRWLLRRSGQYEKTARVRPDRDGDSPVSRPGQAEQAGTERRHRIDFGSGAGGPHNGLRSAGVVHRGEANRCVNVSGKFTCRRDPERRGKDPCVSDRTDTTLVDHGRRWGCQRCVGSNRQLLDTALEPDCGSVAEPLDA